MRDVVMARDLRPGAVVSHRGTCAVVLTVERVADLVAPLQAKVAAPQPRLSIRAAAERLIDVIDSLEVYGREALRVTFDDGREPLDMAPNRAWEWQGQRA